MSLSIPENFKHLYPINLIKFYSVSRGTLQRWARILGLRKSLQHVSLIQSKKASEKTWTSESKDKIRSKCIGRVFSEQSKRKAIETKIKNGTIVKSEKHYKWKGGKPWIRFKNPKYQEWRNSVLNRDNYVKNSVKNTRKGWQHITSMNMRNTRRKDLSYQTD
jgi:hypothetical protein